MLEFKLCIFCCQIVLYWLLRIGEYQAIFVYIAAMRRVGEGVERKVTHHEAKCPTHLLANTKSQSSSKHIV